MSATRQVIRRLLSAAIVLSFWNAPPTGAQDTTLKVAVKRKPTDRQWQYYDTRTVDALVGFDLTADNPRLDPYGGVIEAPSKATGFFYARKIADRWWLIDPLGHRFLHIGVCSVSAGKSAMDREATEKRFTGDEHWARVTNELLRDHGFNGTGAWSATDSLRACDDPPVYTQTWSFMGAFGRAKKLVRQESGHLGYTGQCIPVFHPEFEGFCDRYAEALAKTRSDPYLLGHFSDNELPLGNNVLDQSLKLDVNDPDLRPGYEAAWVWLRSRKGPAAKAQDITDADRSAFLEHVCERYFCVTTQAIRRHDPNHLCLGPRLYGSSVRAPGVLRAAGKYLDVIAINYYGAWTPDRQLMAMWARESGKPFLITEWYAKMIYTYTPLPGSKMYARAVKYGFKEPKTLREWSELLYSPEDIFEKTGQSQKWITPRQFRLITMLEQYIFGMMDLDARDWIARDIRNKSLRMLFKLNFNVGYLIARLKLKLRCFAFPLDYWVFIKIRKLIGV